jgi:hypothetical protein
VTVTRHVPDYGRPFDTHEVGLPTGTMSRTAHTGDGLAEVAPMGSDYSDQVMLLGRVKPGRIGESRRVVHVFVLASQAPHGAPLTARCGETVPADDLQVLPGLTGMPCEYCVQLAMAARR